MSTKICNRAQIKYKTVVDGSMHTVITPQCNTSLTSMDVPLRIICSRMYASVGDEFIYTLTFYNMTPIPLTNLKCHDKLHQDLTYIPNTLLYNGIYLEQEEYDEDIKLPDLEPNRCGVLQFKVYAHQMPDPNIVMNSYYLTYDSLTIHPTTSSFTKPDIHAVEITPTYQDIKYSNITETYFVNINLLLEQTTDTDALRLDGIVHITGSITNAGQNIVEASVITLSFPDGTSYVPNSLTLNGTSIKLTADNNFAVGTITPEDSFNYSYKLHVDEIVPDGNLKVCAICEGTTSIIRTRTPVKSNEVTNIFTTSPAPPISQTVILTISSNYRTIEYGDTFTYYLYIYNPNDFALTELSIEDFLAPELYYIPYSMVLNDESIPFLNFPESFYLPVLKANGSHEISFQVMLNQLPLSSKISNFFLLDYKLTDSGISSHHIDQSAAFDLAASFHSLKLWHLPDHYCLCSQDIIYYKGTITNQSTCDCNDVYLSVHFPADMTVISESVRINEDLAYFTPRLELKIGKLAYSQSISYCYALRLNSSYNSTLVENVSAYGVADEAFPSHPAIVSNTVINTYSYRK